MRPVNSGLAALADAHARLSLQATLTAVTDMHGRGNPVGNLHPRDIFKGVRLFFTVFTLAKWSPENCFVPSPLLLKPSITCSRIHSHSIFRTDEMNKQRSYSLQRYNHFSK